MSKKIFVRGLYSPGVISFDIDHKYSQHCIQTCTPGKAVFDFMYLDKDLTLMAFTKIQEAFSAGDTEQTQSNINYFSAHDAYFTAYINAYLGYLFDRTEEDLSELTAFMGSGFVAPSVDSPDFENELIKHIVASIEQKKAVIKSLVENILEDLRDSDSQYIRGRFIEESITNKLVDFSLNCYFCLDTRALAYPFNSVDDMIRFELMHMLFLDVNFKKCKYCERYFVPSGRSDSLYCDREVPGIGKLCCQVGPLKTFELNHKGDAIHKAYITAYRRMDSRQRAKLITKEEFKEFGKKARAERKRCYDGEITLEQFYIWLNNYK